MLACAPASGKMLRVRSPWSVVRCLSRRTTDHGLRTTDKAMRELLAELTAALEARRGLVYCALVETRGSTPQKAGAAMLVFADGSQRGTLGGCCVEAEVKQRALRTLNNGERAKGRTFNLDSNYGWGGGLIGGGGTSPRGPPPAIGTGVEGFP